MVKTRTKVNKMNKTIIIGCFSFLYGLFYVYSLEHKGGLLGILILSIILIEYLSTDKSKQSSK
jgi:hypothetical protein